MKQVLYAIAAGSIAALVLGAGATGQAGVNVYRLYAAAQADAGITQTRVLGEVTSIDANGKRMTVKTDAGSIVTVILDDKTEYLRVPPGETSLDKAIKIASTEVGVGDKIYVRGRVSNDKKSVPAQRLVVMSRADIQKKHDQERAEWRRRGVSGIVTKLDAESKEVTIQTRGREGVKPVVVAVPDSVKFRRYAPDSVKFSDAKSSTFAELQVGDQLRALGDKSADGARFTAEQIVTGSFRTIGGTVTAVAADTGEIKITMLGSKQAFTILVNKDSLLRRIPPQVAMMIAMRSQGGEGGGPPGAAAGQGQPEGGARPSGQPGAGPGGERMRPEGGGDFQDMLERMPPVTLAEIKPGDVIAVSSTAGADPSRLTAITLVTGVDAILTAMARGPAGARRATNLSTGLPSGVLDFGIGQP
jgi:co-chaperonin GroES (HSP10)